MITVDWFHCWLWLTDVWELLLSVVLRKVKMEQFPNCVYDILPFHRWQPVTCTLLRWILVAGRQITTNLLVLPEILLHGRLLLKWVYVAGWLSLEWNNTLWICPPENTLEADTLSLCLQDPQSPSCSLIGYCRVQLGFMGCPCWLPVQTEGSTRLGS